MEIANSKMQILQDYECAINHAPTVQLTSEIEVTPQHFLKYHHTLDSVQTLLSEVTFDPSYRLVASENNGQLQIQVAMLSSDNYQKKSKKLLFGRSWPVEVNLPTSELLQTAFLALYVAREHEIRERLTLQCDGATTTPLNNHQDMPLITQAAYLLRDTASSLTEDKVKETLKTLHFLGRSFTLESYMAVDAEKVLIVLSLSGSDDELPEFNACQLYLVTSKQDANQFYYDVMDGLLKISKKYITEHFKFKGVARFSHCHDVLKLAKLNRHVRDPKLLALCEQTSIHAAQLNYEVDSTRMPNGCEQQMENFLRDNGNIEIANRHLYTF
ncbi:hypothetical protein [Pseudoalteromonas aurantia]|uniref:Uncharacterized protein n=1 Tax=Pseudoalteromonas aurantia 208 TaxID=1314867 RepID=A0ABR9EDU3_9GAMM|nr:hypothetical protein [Pseudoalteromonas aurantia]MBE0369161.1 hypothetical protein [Pseudoalteromonas aurantia 208]